MRTLLNAEEGKSDNDNEFSATMPTFHHDIDYVVQTWMERKLYKLYPDAGGYNDQDELLMRDWHNLSMYYIRVKNGVISAPPQPVHAASWSTLMGD